MDCLRKITFLASLIVIGRASCRPCKGFSHKLMMSQPEPLHIDSAILFTSVIARFALGPGLTISPPKTLDRTVPTSDFGNRYGESCQFSQHCTIRGISKRSIDPTGLPSFANFSRSTSIHWNVAATDHVMPQSLHTTWSTNFWWPTHTVSYQHSLTMFHNDHHWQ